MGSGPQYEFGELVVPTTFSSRKGESCEHDSSPEILAYSQVGWCFVGKTTAEEGWELLKLSVQESLFCEVPPIGGLVGYLPFLCERTFYD